MSFFGSRDFLLEVSKGNIQGHRNEMFTGVNPSIGKSFETVWDIGGIYTAPIAAETWEVVSDSTDDDGSPLGTGARSVIITGLDTSYISQTEILTLDGTTSVVTTRTDWFRPRNVVVISSGSNRGNVGTITLRVSGGGSTRSTMLPGNCQCFNGFHTIQAGCMGYLLQFTPTIPKNEDITIRGIVTLEGSSTDIVGGDTKIYQSSISVDFKSNPALTEKTDFCLLAKSTNPNVSVNIAFELIEIVQDLNQNFNSIRTF
jgi:hypothetical protein